MNVQLNIKRWNKTDFSFLPLWNVFNFRSQFIFSFFGGVQERVSVHSVWRRFLLLKVFFIWGSGFGKIGRAVASDTRDTQFESSCRQTLCYQLYNWQLYWIHKNMANQKSFVFQN